jgi:hypothetical protein
MATKRNLRGRDPPEKIDADQDVELSNRRSRMISTVKGVTVRGDISLNSEIGIVSVRSSAIRFVRVVEKFLLPLLLSDLLQQVVVLFADLTERGSLNPVGRRIAHVLLPAPM